MRNSVVLVLLLFVVSVGFCKLEIERILIRRNVFHLSLRTFPPASLHPLDLLQRGSTLWTGYDIRVFKKAQFPERDIFLTNIQVRYEVRQDFLNDGFVARVWHGGNFSYKRWFSDTKRLVRFLYRLEDFRLFSFTEPQEGSYFYVEVSQFFDFGRDAEAKNDAMGQFFRTLIGLRHEFSAVRSRVFSKDGILLE